MLTFDTPVQLMDRGLAVAQFNAGALMLAFCVWGVLMGMAGALLAWVLSGQHLTADDHYEPRPFVPGQIGVPTCDIESTTIVLPARNRLLDEASRFVGRAGTATVPQLHVTAPAQPRGRLAGIRLAGNRLGSTRLGAIRLPAGRGRGTRRAPSWWWPR